MRTLAFFLLAVFLPSCGTFRVIEDFAPIGTVPCMVYPEEVFLFFAGENPDVAYQRIGVITIKGNHETSTEEALNRLKAMASSHCANAVLGVQTSVAQRHYMSDISSEATVVSGLAVRVTTDSTFRARYGHMGSTGFHTKVQKAKEAEDREEATWTTFGVLGGLAMGVLFLLIVASNDEE